MNRNRSQLGRRALLKGAGVGLALGVLSASGCASLQSRPTSRIVVVGGGFGGVSAARMLKQLEPNAVVTLIEPRSRYIACPLSNLVIAGYRPMSKQLFEYEALKAADINWVKGYVENIDPVMQVVETRDGSRFDYDRMILAPGISLKFDAIDGYSEMAATQMPHAWQAGNQTERLRQQITDMPDGGVVAIAAPANPYRCPPGPYERASLIASFLKRYKSRSKVLLLDSKDSFSKQALFQSAWQNQLGGYIEWQGLSSGANVVGVDPDTKTVFTEFDSHQVDVANIIPPQAAGSVAVKNGLANASGWCPVDALTFESTIAPNIHVIGDAAILNAMPKSAFAANAQAKLCAAQVIRLLKGFKPLDVPLANTCYSLVEPDYGISVAGVYQAQGSRWLGVEGAGGVSPLGASSNQREQEASYAHEWFRAITAEVFA